MKRLILFIVLSELFSSDISAQNLGYYSANPYALNSTSNPYGAGSPYTPNSIHNPYGQYGSPYSNQSVNNPYATNAPRIYNQNGNYHGRLSSNP
jgi:hypothetical protein